MFFVYAVFYLTVNFYGTGSKWQYYNCLILILIFKIKIKLKMIWNELYKTLLSINISIFSMTKNCSNYKK